MGIVAVTLAGYDERVDHRGAVAGVGVAHEEPVLRSEFARADRILDGVGIELGVVVAQVRAQRGPVAEQISAGVAETRSGQHARLQRRDEPAEAGQRPGKVFLPQRGALRADLRFVPCALERVELADQPEDALGSFRPLGGRLEEAPSGVRPAADPLDAGVRACIGGIRFVAVRLDFLLPTIFGP